MFLISTRLSLQHTEILDYRFPRSVHWRCSLFFSRSHVCVTTPTNFAPANPLNFRGTCEQRSGDDSSEKRIRIEPWTRFGRGKCRSQRVIRAICRRHCVPTRDSRGKLPVQFPSPAEKWNESVALFEKSLSCGINYGDGRIILKVRSQFSPKH